MTGLHAAYRFDTLVVGAANRTAVTAARAVAESPGSVYNPLFIYSRPGLGKTHLLVAIGHAVRAVNPAASVAYLTLDEFVEDYHGAVASGVVEAFRQRYATQDVLLLDDVQLLGRRLEMHEELLRTIDALQAAGRQIVLTSDRPPAEIESLDERLLRRVAGGLVIDIARPDFETQVAILRRRADERGAPFGADVLEAVATLGIESVRELIGALNRLIAFQAVSEAPLDPNQARVLIGGPDAVAHATVASQAVAEHEDAPPPSRPAAMEETLASKPAVVAERDEFGDFLSELASTLAQQVDPWRTRVGEAILRWEGEGFRTTVLNRLLEQDDPTDPDGLLIQYEADAERLLELQREVAELAPDMAGAPALTDPGNMAAAEAYLHRVRESAAPPPGPSPAWALDALVEGAGNRMALRAIAAIATEPGTRYNPLVLVGGPGVGKTHLLHGLGNALVAAGLPHVACLPAQEFTQELIDAIDRDAVLAWRNRYRRCSALLLDDVHSIAGRERTQEELFLLFNIFIESGRQLAFTSAAPLAELSGVEPRLLTRLEGGLVVDLPPPDRDLRQQVVERLLSARGLSDDAELSGYLASRPADSVRTLQGFVKRVLLAADAQQATATVAMARELLEGAARPVRRSGLGRSTPLPTAGGPRSREKMVWQWPDLADCVIEEWR
ncbi:MAG TPA: DnaA/Hda family protein [Gemmatimonadales bacterium]|nr:DnaA/Hda family protein [Gemmatimonadales bacterium]